MVNYFGKLTSVRRIGGLGFMISWSAVTASVVTLPLIISSVTGRGDAVTLSGRGDTSITLSGGIREDTVGGGIA